MPERWVESIARALSDGTSRRGLLQGLTLTASAFALHPLSRADAWTADAAQVGELLFMAECNGDPTASDPPGRCGDGYTEFCCSMNSDHRNICPDYAFFGGYWRARPYKNDHYCKTYNVRYMIDCNVFRDRGTNGQGDCTCRCANRDCDCRWACCTEYQYGNCNHKYADKPYTDIVCRVIKCENPASLGYNCSRDYIDDPETANHEPCRLGSCVYD